MMNNLRKIRIAKLLTQEELAKKSGLNRLTILRLEAGDYPPELRTIRDLARALEVKPEELGFNCEQN